MTLSSLDTEPAIKSPLKSRAIESDAMHRLAFIVITVLLAILAIAFAVATVKYLGGSLDAATAWASYAFTGLAALWFFFLLADAWFGSWIRLDGLQRTHFILLGLAMLGLSIVQA